MRTKTGLAGGLLFSGLVVFGAQAGTYLCDGNTVTDQPWHYQNCVNVLTKQSYVEESKGRQRSGIFKPPAQSAPPPTEAMAATSRDDLLKGRQRKRLDKEPTKELTASCLSKWRDLMEDPESAEILSANVDEVRNLDRPAIAPWYEIVLEIKARDGQGKPIEDTFVCGIMSTDETDDQTTQVYQTWFKMGLRFHTLKAE